MKIKFNGFVKKIATLLLVMLVSFNSVIPAWADPAQETSSNVAELRRAVENRLSTFNQVDLSKYGGVLGVFHNMQVILSQAIWTDFVMQDTTLGIPETTKQYQKEALIKRIREFNETFHKDNDKYKGVTIDVNSVGSVEGEQLNNFSLTNIVNDIANYSKTFITGIKDGKEEEEILSQYRQELRYIYKMVDACGVEVKAINSLIPAKEVEKDGLIEVQPQTPYSPKALDPLVALLDAKSNPEISGILRKAQELRDDELQEITPDNIDNSKELLDRFYKDGSFKTEELINSYFMIFSASSIYEPFVSHVGDDSFMTALKELSGERGEESELIKLFNDAKMYKKPLYYRELGRDGKPKGPAERITLGVFVDYMLKDGTSGALVLPRGVYEQPEDSNSYMIYQSQRYYYTGDQSINDANNNTNGGDTSNDSTGTNGTENTGDDSESLIDADGISGQEVAPNAPEDTDTDTNENSEEDKDTSKDTSVNRQTKEEWKKSLQDVEAFSHDTPITNEDYMTPAVFKWGKDNKSNKTFLGTVIGRNIVNDVAKIDKFSKDNGLLFMNCFGDIVTENDTVIIPGSANPAFYNEDQYYFPYTFAFMKSYPSLKLASKVFESTNEKDKGKYILSINNNGDGDDDKTKEEKEEEKETDQISGTKLGPENSYEIIARQIDDAKGLKYDSQAKIDLKVQATMKQLGDGTPTMLTFKHFDFENTGGGWFGNFFSNMQNKAMTSNWLGSGKEMMMVKNLQSTYSNQTKTVLFDTDLEDMQPQDLAVVAGNFYWGIMADEQGNIIEPNDKLNTELFAKEIVPEALNGLQDAIGYAKNTFDYDDMVKDQFGRFMSLLKDTIESIINAPASLRGVLGIESAYQNPIFGRILVQYKLFIPLLVVLVIVLCIVRYMGSRSDLGQLSIVVIATLACSIFFTSIFPVYIPMVYNTGASTLNKNLSYVSLLMKSEDYDNLMTEQHNDKGEVELHTMSINLYKLSNDDLDHLCSKLNITPEEAGSGKSFPLDAGSGLYLEGNIIKLNLDKLFGNLPIVGSYKPGDNGKAYYQLEMQKRQSNNVDYYMPYYLMTKAFIGKLNDLAKVYELNRSTVKYDRMVKDSFMVNAYINSAPFLIPGEFDKMSETIEPGVLENIKTIFGDTDDWLGLGTFLTEPLEEGQDSLWYRTLMQNGYIHDSMYELDSASKEAENARNKMNKLISEVNMLTKEFILSNKDSFAGMSDENLIKIISLHATLIFNQKVGDWWANLYPMFLNAEELTINDVLVAAYTSNSDRFRSEEMNIVSYIAYKYEIGGLLILTLIILLTSFSTLVIKLFIPLLYVLLFIFSIFKFAGKRSLDTVASGFLKCSLTLLVLFTLNVFGMYIAFVMDGSFMALGLQLVLAFNITDTLIKLMGAILRDLSNLGNSQFHTVAPWMLQATGILDAIDDLRVKTTNIGKGYDPRVVDDIKDKAYERFRHGRGMDEFYESEVIMRGGINKHRKRSEEIRKTAQTLQDEYEDFKHI